jgi:hypothetical protein
MILFRRRIGCFQGADPLLDFQWRFVLPPMLSVEAGSSLYCPLNVTVTSLAAVIFDRVIRPGKAEALNCASGKIDDDPHRKWLRLRVQ